MRVFVILPLIWIVGWVVVAGLIAAFSGLDPRGEGLVLFFVIFGAGGIGLPIVAALGWVLARRLRNR